MLLGGVSIHAPTWGATDAQGCFCSYVGFNPRAHVGRDLHDILVRPVHVGFNPRAHVGRDKNRQ